MLPSYYQIRHASQPVIVQQVHPQYAAQMHAYYLRNMQHLHQWEPTKSWVFRFQWAWQRLLKIRLQAMDDRHQAHWLLCTPDQQVIGCINLTRRLAQHPIANLGYSLDPAWQGFGVMHHALLTLSRILLSGYILRVLKRFTCLKTMPAKWCVSMVFKKRQESLCTIT